MSTYRFWRIAGIDTPAGGVLALTEVQLHDGIGRVDHLAALTCSIAPEGAPLSGLSDGSLTEESRWPRRDYYAPGFSLTWDFGAGSSIDIVALKFGSSTAQKEFIESFDLAFSSDGINWLTYLSARGVLWPGANTFCTLTVTTVVAESFLSSPASKFDTALGTPTISWDSTNSALSIAGGTAQHFVRLNNIGRMAPNVDSWVEMDVKLVADSANFRHVGMFLGTGVGSAGYRLFGFNSTMGVSLWNEGGMESGYSASSLGNAFVLGSTVTVRVDRSAAGVFRISSGATTYFTSSANSTYVDLLPGFFVYGATILVYEVRLGGGAAFNTGVGGAVLRPHVVRSGGVLPGSFSPQTGITAPVVAGTLHDTEFGGIGRVQGTVKEKGTTANTPLHRRVVLIEERSRIAIRETWSDALTGSYEFSGVKEGGLYTVLSYDHAGTFRAVVADRIVPELIP